MKKIFSLFSILAFLSVSLSAQAPDTAFVQAASDLYQPKAFKSGVAISPTAPLPLFRKADNKMKWIEENAAKNTVISIATTLFATGNTPYAGKFIKENNSQNITCFIDKNGAKHLINKTPTAGNSGVQVEASNPNSDFLGSFVKEEGKTYITAYVDAYGTRHSVGADAATLTTTASNGITKVGTSLKLGGSLSEPTTITATTTYPLKLRVPSAYTNPSTGRMSEANLLVTSNDSTYKVSTYTFVQSADTIGQYSATRAGLLPSSAAATFQNKSQHDFYRDIDNQNLIDTAAQIRSDLSNNINYVESKIDGKTLSISGQNLTLSGGNTVTLPFSAADSSFRQIGTNVKGGAKALFNLTTGINNVGIGATAMQNATTASNCFAIGDSSLYTTSNRSFSFAIGNAALRNYTSSITPPFAIGNLALYNATNGRGLMAIGNSALYNVTTGGTSLGIGDKALYSLTTGNSNVAIGYQIAFSLTTGSRNTIIGNSSFGGNTIGSGNTGIGYYAGKSLIGSGNIAIGDSSIYAMTIGDNNIAIGKNATMGNGDNQLNIGNWITGINGAITIPNTLTVQKLTATTLPTYADDAAADADTALVSGSLYRITGSRIVYIKP